MNHALVLVLVLGYSCLFQEDCQEVVEVVGLHTSVDRQAYHSQHWDCLVLLVVQMEDILLESLAFAVVVAFVVDAFVVVVVVACVVAYAWLVSAYLVDPLPSYPEVPSLPQVHKNQDQHP